MQPRPRRRSSSRSCGARTAAGPRSSRRTTFPPNDSGMKRDARRILTTHAGSLPRSEELKQTVFARAEGRPYDRGALAKRLKSEVAEVVRKQIACGVDSVNDGEVGKTNFNNYVRERLAGFEARPYEPGKSPQPLSIAGRELRKFPEYFAAGGRRVW